MTRRFPLSLGPRASRLPPRGKGSGQSQQSAGLSYGRPPPAGVIPGRGTAQYILQERRRRFTAPGSEESLFAEEGGGELNLFLFCCPAASSFKRRRWAWRTRRGHRPPPNPPPDARIIRKQIDAPPRPGEAPAQKVPGCFREGWGNERVTCLPHRPPTFLSV